MSKLARSHRDLEVYQRAFEAAVGIFEAPKAFPREETYSLTDQIRRSSRSVCANRAEAWRKRRYRAAFASKLSDCEAEAAETQVWLEFALKCQYLDRETALAYQAAYDRTLATVVGMLNHSETWVLRDGWSSIFKHSPPHPFTRSPS